MLRCLDSNSGNDQNQKEIDIFRMYEFQGVPPRTACSYNNTSSMVIKHKSADV